MVSGAALIEAQHSGVEPGRWNVVLSQLRLEPLSVEWAKEAARLLQDGHTDAITAPATRTVRRAAGVGGRPLALSVVRAFLRAGLRPR